MDTCLLSILGEPKKVPGWEMPGEKEAFPPGEALSVAQISGDAALKLPRRGRYSVWFRLQSHGFSSPMAIELKILIGADKSTGSACYYVHGMFSHNLGKARIKDFSQSAKRAQVKVNFVHGVDGSKVTDRPDCLPEGHKGYLGMWHSMLKVWKRALERCPAEWIVDFEDDAQAIRHRTQQ